DKNGSGTESCHPRSKRSVRVVPTQAMIGTDSKARGRECGDKCPTRAVSAARSNGTLSLFSRHGHGCSWDLIGGEESVERPFRSRPGVRSDLVGLGCPWQHDDGFPAGAVASSRAAGGVVPADGGTTAQQHRPGPAPSTNARYVANNLLSIVLRS